jgi:hypothetical protein
MQTAMVSDNAKYLPIAVKAMSQIQFSKKEYKVMISPCKIFIVCNIQ